MLEVLINVLIVVIIFFTPFIAGCILWDCTTTIRPAKWLYHDRLGFHEPNPIHGSYIDINGRVHAFCKYCGRYIHYDEDNDCWI